MAKKKNASSKFEDLLIIVGVIDGKLDIVLDKVQCLEKQHIDSDRILHGRISANTRWINVMKGVLTGVGGIISGIAYLIFKADSSLIKRILNIE